VVVSYILNSGRASLNFLSGAGNDAYVFFGNSSAGNAGYVGYENTANRLVLRSSDFVSLLDSTGEVIRIDGGNVGIGTVTPLVGLDVRGTTIITNQSGNNYNENLRLPQNPTGYAVITLGGAIAANGSDANQWSLLRNPSNEFEIRRQDTVLALINPSGNLGIGTNPQTPFKLDVNGAGRFNYYIRLHDGNNPWDIGALFNYTNSDLFFSMNGSEKMRMNSNGQLCIGYSGANATGANSLIAAGNVGIGITTPSAKLDVNGDTYIRGTEYIFQSVNNTTGYLYFDHSGTQVWKQGVFSDNTSTFSIGNGGGFTRLFNITNAGNVGINNSTPKYSLDVYEGSGIAASFGGQFSPGSFGGIHFGYLETPNTSYRKSALVFERTDNHGQGGNASGRIFFLLNNLSAGSATSLADAIMTIDTDSVATQGSARVGIGTTSSVTSPLRVQGGDAMTGGWNKNAMLAATYPVLLFNSLGKYAGIGYDYSAALRIWINAGTEDVTATTPVVNILNTGNVGIGTGDPTRRLDVREGNVQIVANFQNTSTTSSRIKFTDANTGAENVNIGATGTSLAMWTNNTVRMTILSGGNVGIGTASPIRDLMIGDLASTSTATPKTLSLGGTFSNSAGSNVKLKVYDDTGANVGGMSVSSGQMEVNTWSSGKIAFYRGTTQTMIIDASGNLGINTANSNSQTPRKR
jgi:hypothetical protein